MDHVPSRQLIQSRFDAQLTPAHGIDDASESLETQAFDFVLVNRQFDRDQSDGIEVIRELESHTRWSGVLTMLVSNFPEHQQSATAAGGEPGCGKAALQATVTRQGIARILEL
ncbi:MAG: response regulator [Planctomycetaceae bacterium]|nr:response regulator [Planctomycetaceae bacterium]MBP63165.1 response regulator [Planctomycetaceae bacterium]